jgi:thiol-disulfide isomerase/thioredoxin
MELFFIVALIILIIFLTMSSSNFSFMGTPSITTTVIWFYRPGCGFCTRMEPAWAEFASMVPANINIRKINTLENREMADDFGVSGVPFIVKVTDNDRQIYEGDRSAQDLLRFCQN